ncbi:MAG TPA: RNA methyltransferase [Candidatus Binatia bacterium]|nr:RNA methyltransferase [Candidatus Binatia bacterium]
MAQPLISSHRNAVVKRVRKLQQKKYRQREGAFFLEGIRVVLAALEQRAPVEMLIYAPELLTSNLALQAIEEQRALGREVVATTADIFRSLSGRDNPVGLGAVVSARIEALESLHVSQRDIYVAVEDISDPGNLGTIVRTVDAVGGAGLILVGQTTDPFHPTAVKASMGALFNVPVTAVESLDELWPWAQEYRLQTIATSAHAAQSFWEAPYRLPALLLFGSESEGLSSAVQQRADLAVVIPMMGISSSLNLAVAAGMLLYELRRVSSFPY